MGAHARSPFVGRLAPAVTSLLFATGWLTGCRDERRIELRDTEGRRYQARCEPRKPCELAPNGGRETPRLDQSGYLTLVCEAAAPEAANIGLCRALECERDADCPPEPDLPKGMCLAGLCARADRALRVEDGIALCLAGTGVPKGSREQVERRAMALTCGAPCQVPSLCRRPHP